MAGGAARSVARELRKHGYQLAAKAEGFIVTGAEGPLRDGELERARNWGAGARPAAACLPGADQASRAGIRERSGGRQLDARTGGQPTLTTGPVPRQLVSELVAAATRAPSMHNTQPWRFRYTAARQTIDLYADSARTLPVRRTRTAGRCISAAGPRCSICGWRLSRWPAASRWSG